MDGRRAADVTGSVRAGERLHGGDQAAARPASDVDTHIVHRGEHVFAILNAFPYSVGHTLVLPYREVADLEDLAPDEFAELWATVTDVVRAIKAAYQPEGINVGVNLGRPAGGSVSEHLHVHVVPRWTGDGNFMTAIANTRTLPEALPDSAAKIRNAWSGQGSLRSGLSD